MLDLQVVTPDYFRTLGIALTHGRGFTEGDVAGAPPAVVVSASVARHYWPAADAVGQRLAMGRGTGEQFTVVGTVPDTRYRDLRSDRPSVYFPIGQSFFPVVPMTLLIRASHSPAGLVPALRRVMAEEGSGVEVARAVPFERFLEEPLAQPRLSAMLLSAFGGAAALLAGIGLFGVIAATVRTRTRELGIRMALGANSGEVRRLVTMRGLRIALTGALVGLAATLLSGRLLAALLYEVRPADPTMLALTIAVLLVVAAIATILPAQASTRIDPAIALRVDV